jgi:hypothetical protein
MIQAGKHRVENGLECYDDHASDSEIKIKDHDGREEKEKKGEEDGADKKLVEIVVARVYTIPEDIVLLTPE